MGFGVEKPAKRSLLIVWLQHGRFFAIAWYTTVIKWVKSSKFRYLTGK